MRHDNKKNCHAALLLASLLLSACSGGSVETSSLTSSTTIVAASAPAVTSTGTDFYLTLPDHLCVSVPAECNYAPVSNKLIIAASAATTGEVSFNNVLTPFSVAAGGQTVIALDSAVVLTANELVEAKGIHVTALLPVSVYVVSENLSSADGYLALPTPGLGTAYYVMSYASAGDTGSEFAVVATQNATTVSITPAAAGATKQAGVAFTVMLNAGETYQLSNPAFADMTGSLVTSDKPIAVFSGHACANIPSNVGYCDYMVEQLPSVSSWGNTFHTSVFSGRARYTARIVASQDGTTFTTLPAGLVGTLNAGQFVDVDLTTAAEFVSSNPVLVAQFMRGYEDDTSRKGDPSMVLVTPEEMGMTDATFGVHAFVRTTGAYMNIVTETAAIASLTLDSVAVSPVLFTPMGGTSIYSVATIPLAAGAHTLKGTSPYTAFVYGYGGSYLDAISYAYPVAATLVAASAGGSTYACADSDDESHDGTGHDALDALHTGYHPHQHAHERSHNGAHDHAHAGGDDEDCHE